MSAMAGPWPLTPRPSPLPHHRPRCAPLLQCCAAPPPCVATCKSKQQLISCGPPNSFGQRWRSIGGTVVSGMRDFGFAEFDDSIPHPDDDGSGSPSAGHGTVEVGWRVRDETAGQSSSSEGAASLPQRSMVGAWSNASSPARSARPCRALTFLIESHCPCSRNVALACPCLRPSCLAAVHRYGVLCTRH